MTRSNWGRAVIVGGSLSGLMSALALSRAGMDVTILERFGAFTRTGGAIGLEPSRLRGLARLGVTPPAANMRGTSPVATWFALHAKLQAAVNANSRIMVRHETVVHDVSQDHESAWAITVGGETVRGDLVVGADGHRSVVRRRVAPERPNAKFAGYLIWLGLSDESRMPLLRPWPQEVTMLSPGDAYFFGYPLPGHDGALEPGGRQLGWAWYDARQNAMLRETGCVVDGIVQHSLTGERVPEAIYRALADKARRELPSPWRDAVVETVARRAVIGTPIAEYVPDRLVDGRVVLVGDAAHVPTPMTGMGFSESLADAEALAECLAGAGQRDGQFPSVVNALRAYERRRPAPARRLVQSGQQFSRGFARDVA